MISDIHANADALDAVIRRIQEMDIDSVVCLGDLVGYNAEPRECIEKVRTLTGMVVAGNHDWEIARGTTVPGISSTAHQTDDWTRLQLEKEHLDYLAGLPGHLIQPPEFVAVHGCYLNEVHVNGYITGTMLEKNLMAIESRKDWPPIAFCGHTHVPMCGWLEEGGCVEVPLKQEVRWPRKAGAVLINPGSVGQPRDGDPRASFAVVDTLERLVTFCRVSYDVEKTAAGIVAAGLPSSIADRLRVGR